MHDPDSLLFVYGTLLGSAKHPLGQMLAAQSRPLGAGSIRAQLYVISEIDEQGENRYPGAIPSPDAADRVYGQVFALDDPKPLLAQFDEYEACSPNWPEPHEFLLRRVPVHMDTGEVLNARSYLYTWDVGTAQRITSGRFTDEMPDAR